MDTRNIVRHASVLLGVLAVLTGSAASAGAGDATDQLRAPIDQVLRVLDDPRLKGPAMTTERRAAIRRVMDGVIDFPDSARRALGPYWRERSEAERAEFVALFRELVTLDTVDTGRLGVAGASSGAAAALLFASGDRRVKALALRSGNPSGAELAAEGVHAPTLLIVGARDAPILALTEKLLARLGGPNRMEVVPGGDHLFEDPAALRRAATLTVEWFVRHLNVRSAGPTGARAA